MPCTNNASCKFKFNTEDTALWVNQYIYLKKKPLKYGAKPISSLFHHIRTWHSNWRQQYISKYHVQLNRNNINVVPRKKKLCELTATIKVVCKRSWRKVKAQRHKGHHWRDEPYAGHNVLTSRQKQTLLLQNKDETFFSSLLTRNGRLVYWKGAYVDDFGVMEEISEWCFFLRFSSDV